MLRVAEDAAEARQRPYPNVFLGGHYPQSAGPDDGTQFAFTVRQAFNSAAYADGYWIWTDWKPSEGWQGTKQDWIDAMMDPSDVAASPAVSIARQSAQEKQREVPVTIADNLRSAHKLVSEANQQLQEAKVDSDRLITRPRYPVLDVVASKASLRRCLLIMDALLKALEQQGYAVGKGPVVEISGVSLHFCISEQLEEVREHVDEVDLDGRYEFGHSRVKKHQAPSGRLTLQIKEGGQYWARGLRHTWRDTSKTQLDNKLSSVVVGLVELAARTKEHEEEQRKQEELRRQAEVQRREEAARRAERQKQYKAEKTKFETLLSQAENLHKSTLVRGLIQSVQDKHSRRGPIDPQSDIAAWIKWANLHADRLDPTLPSPPSILDETDLEEKPPHRWDYGRGW